MLLLALIAFSRTFYLRPLFAVDDLTARLGQPRLPFHVVLHGLLMTLWLLLFCWQAWLVFLGKTAVHRRFGTLGIGVAVLIVVSAAVTTFRFIPRMLEDGKAFDVITTISVRDFLVLVTFVVFVALAVLWRTRPATHKRLMLLASVVLLSQAFAGGNRPLGAFLQQFFPDPLGLGIYLATNTCFVVALAGHDYWLDRRIHAVTIWAGAVVVSLEFILLALIESGMAESMIRWVA